jgi:hypothetical protein
MDSFPGLSQVAKPNSSASNHHSFAEAIIAPRAIPELRPSLTSYTAWSDELVIRVYSFYYKIMGLSLEEIKLATEEARMAWADFESKVGGKDVFIEPKKSAARKNWELPKTYKVLTNSRELAVIADQLWALVTARLDAIFVSAAGRARRLSEWSQYPHPRRSKRSRLKLAA